MKTLYLRCRHYCTGLIMLTICAAFFMGCSDAQETQESREPAVAQETQESREPAVAQETQESRKPGVAQVDEETVAENSASDAYWLIEVSDTKKFVYAIPSSNGRSIDMTATLHFIAWKEGGAEMFGQYEGRALVGFDMDLSKAGVIGVTYTGGVMDDSISDNISFELLPMQQEEVSVEGEDINLAPLTKIVGDAEILTDEYSISRQAWKALADGQVKLDVNGGFGDGTRNPQSFKLKAGENTIMVSVGDFAAAYKLDAFTGKITKADAGVNPISWFRDKVMSRMEERLAMSGQSANQQPSPAAPGGTAAMGGLTFDSEGREGMDTNGDGRLEMYFDKDGKAWADFDGDGKYEIVGEDGTDMDEN